MADTTTTLNPGASGDVMDESLVTQSDNVTQAKRPRVVPGGDDGSLQTFNKDGAFNYAHVTDPRVMSALSDVIDELKRIRVSMQLILSRMGGDYKGGDDLDAFADE